MKRRDLIVGGIGAAGLAATSKTKAQKKDVFKWKMVTTWPPNFPGLGTGAMRMAKNIEAASLPDVQDIVAAAKKSLYK